jgi:RNA polymerase sigma factor (sigma-70 family)
MAEDAGFREMIRRVREGSSDAAWELVERYGPALRRVVRSKLNRRLRPQFDSLDFVQMVWSSFFRAPGKLERFGSPDELVAFLVGMARNKVVTEVRRQLMTKRHDLNRERSLDALGGRGRLGIPDRQPSPLDVAIARERWGRLLSDQPEHYQQIIRLRLQGHTYQAIADSLEINERTVRRVLQKLLEERAA